jgi:hypothetical protein
VSLQVVTRSTDEDLTTTGALRRAQLGATATSTAQDQLFSDSIRQASRWAQTFIGQPLTVQTYRECVAGYGRRTLRLSRTPVRAILAVYDATDTGTAQQLATSEFRVQDADAGLLSRDQGFSWNATMGGRVGVATFGGDAVPLDPFPSPGMEYEPWLVDYIAGWTYAGVDPASTNYSTAAGSLTGTDTGRTLPEDIEAGVLARAEAFVNGASEVEMEKLGDLEVNYRSLGTDRDGRLITRYDLLLEPYRRVV